MRNRAIPFLLFASFVAAGCASGGQGELAEVHVAPLTEADMADYQNFTALGVIRVLRPGWLATDPSRIRVFCGPESLGGVGDLSDYKAGEIREIRYHPQRQTTATKRTYAYITVTLKG